VKDESAVVQDPIQGACTAQLHKEVLEKAANGASFERKMLKRGLSFVHYF
jgi:hypothetical protein